MTIEIRFANYCLWCDDVEIPMDKMICSKKCLKEMNRLNPQSSYTMDDVAIPSKPKKGKI